MRKSKLLFLTSLATILTLTGCASGNHMASSDITNGVTNYKSSEASYYEDDYDYGYTNDYYEDYEYYAEESAMADYSLSETPKQDVATNRKLIKDASLDVETENLDEFVAKLKIQINEMGGYIENSNVSGTSMTYSYTQKKSAYFTIRVPQDKLDNFVEYVENGANILNKSENVEDVTLAYYDTEARKETLQTERERILELLEKAEDLTDVIILEDKLSDIEYQIDSLTSTLKTYDSLVEYSTIRLSVSEVEKYTPVDYKEPTLGERIARGFTENIEAVKDNLGNLMVALVSMLPHLAILAIIVIIIIVIIKLIIRNHRKKHPKKVNNTVNTVNPYNQVVQQNNENTTTNNTQETNNDKK